MTIFLLDADPAIPTGCVADAERVAELLVDPESPITAEIVEMLPDSQQPTAEQIQAAAQGAV